MKNKAEIAELIKEYDAGKPITILMFYEGNDLAVQWVNAWTFEYLRLFVSEDTDLASTSPEEFKHYKILAHQNLVKRVGAIIEYSNMHDFDAVESRVASYASNIWMHGYAKFMSTFIKTRLTTTTDFVKNESDAN